MQLHSISPRTPFAKSTSVGRGGKRGKTSGRGNKGQNSRAGAKKRPEWRDIIKRLPKLRGRGKNSNISIQTKDTVLNLKDLSSFAAKEVVSPKTLLEKRLIRVTSGVTPVVKILGTGELKVALTVEGCKVSTSAKAAIEKAGGSVK